MLIISRGTICWEELCPKSLCRYLVCWISNEVHWGGLVISDADTGCLNSVDGFRRCGSITTFSMLAYTYIGVNSIERSAQEGHYSLTWDHRSHSVDLVADTLLVLFNAAISNLVGSFLFFLHPSDSQSPTKVLFRNNFALSRDITSTFKVYLEVVRVFDIS